MLEHDNVKIAGKASDVQNRQGENSELYMVPRNYLRVKVNSKTGFYEFGKEKRDYIVSKFVKKSPIVNIAFQEIEGYLGD